METKYQRIPLAVDALFTTDGSFQPKKIYYRDTAYEISKVMQIRKYCPKVVSCIAPLEYTVMVDSQEKKIYYEKDTNTWFSVKEVFIENERKSDTPQRR